MLSRLRQVWLSLTVFLWWCQERLRDCLCLKEEGSEAIIVALIRESGVNANIDSANKQLVVATQKRSMTQMVIDLSKSRNLEHRSNQLIAQVKKKWAVLDGAQ